MLFAQRFVALVGLGVFLATPVLAAGVEQLWTFSGFGQASFSGSFTVNGEGAISGRLRGQMAAEGCTFDWTIRGKFAAKAIRYESPQSSNAADCFTTATATGTSNAEFPNSSSASGLMNFDRGDGNEMRFTEQWTAHRVQ